LIEAMIDKQTITIHKPLPYMVPIGLRLHELAAKLKRAINIEAPIGYQDENGFHMGVKPTERKMKWPPGE
jgi:hypothetical protein